MTNNTVKTSVIKKQYKGKDGQTKIIEINYAKVADRIKSFRSDNPRSKISTRHRILSNGDVEFKAYVWKDKTDFMEILKSGVSEEIALLSADGEGTAESNATRVKDEKGFEKLETIAIGRALANFGYLVTGEVASSEEMEEFEAYMKKREAQLRQAAIKTLESAKDMDSLRDNYIALEPKYRTDKEIIAVKDKMKDKLAKGAEDDSKSVAAK